MFTGIVQDTGRVKSVERAEGGLRLSIAPARPLSALRAGESICTDGVCLTAEPESSPERLIFFLSEETLARTTLGSLASGSLVNLERSLAAGDRLGGHLVMGHVDGVGTVRRLERHGEGWDLEIVFPPGLAPFLALKGSISVDGISLTVAGMTHEIFSAALIPHTYNETSLREKRPGSKVNLEADTIARYVVQYLSSMNRPGGIDADLLARAGFKS